MIINRQGWKKMKKWDSKGHNCNMEKLLIMTLSINIQIFCENQIKVTVKNQ